MILVRKKFIFCSLKLYGQQAREKLCKFCAIKLLCLPKAVKFDFKEHDFSKTLLRNYFLFQKPCSLMVKFFVDVSTLANCRHFFALNFEN